ncbi:MAG: hypothetical protein ABIP06_08365 [Pyrinomonadaceae bacterium]
MNKTNGRKLFGKSGKYYALVGSFILLIAVTHFVMQLSFIQKENLRSVETAVEVDKVIEPKVDNAVTTKQIIEIAPELVEVKKVEVIIIPEVVKAAPRQSREIVPAVKISTRKKSVRQPNQSDQSRDERLRRAERLLTGN